jgi:hypothetical protein
LYLDQKETALRQVTSRYPLWDDRYFRIENEVNPWCSGNLRRKVFSHSGLKEVAASLQRLGHEATSAIEQPVFRGQGLIEPLLELSTSLARSSVNFGP